MQAQPLLPHQTDRIFLTDGGIETWLMYKRGFELPHFSAYQLLDDPAGRAALEQYYRDFAALARERRTAYIFAASPTGPVGIGAACSAFPTRLSPT